MILDTLRNCAHKLCLWQYPERGVGPVETGDSKCSASVSRVRGGSRIWSKESLLCGCDTPNFNNCKFFITGLDIFAFWVQVQGFTTQMHNDLLESIAGRIPLVDLPPPLHECVKHMKRWKKILNTAPKLVSSTHMTQTNTVSSAAV